MKCAAIGPSARSSAEPSLVFVCDSNTGSCTRTHDRGLDACADVGGVVLLLENPRITCDERLAEGGEVRAALRGVLAVDEGIVFLAAVVAVGEGDLDVLALEMDDRIERLAADFLAQQIQQAVLGAEVLAVEREREAGLRKA